MRSRTKLVLLLLLGILMSFLLEFKLPSQQGLAERYVFHARMIGPLFLTSVQDRETREDIFWYDSSRGLEVKHIDQPVSGKWIVTLAPRVQVGYERSRASGISDRYIFQTRILGSTLLTRVTDQQSLETILWYDLDAGPDIEHIERLESGEQVITLVRRP